MDGKAYLYSVVPTRLCYTSSAASCRHLSNTLNYIRVHHISRLSV